MRRRALDVALDVPRLGPVSAPQGALDVRWNTRGGLIVRQSLEDITMLPLERILVAHSDPLESRPIEQLEEAWRLVRA